MSRKLIIVGEDTASNSFVTVLLICLTSSGNKEESELCVATMSHTVAWQQEVFTKLLEDFAGGAS